MTPSTLLRARRRGFAAAAAAAALALTATVAPTTALARPADPGGTQTALDKTAERRTATVMTRNLYLGAELGTIVLALASGNEAAIVTAATTTWNATQATHPEARMAAVAAEIAEETPALVGLQEVTTWTTYAYNAQTGAFSNPTVTYDFLALLMHELARLGVHYDVVEGATAHNFTSPPVPVLSQTGLTTAVQLADRDVILRRSDVNVTNAQSGSFDTVLKFPVAGGFLEVARGWGSVDVHDGLVKFRFVNSHLEAFGQPPVPERPGLPAVPSATAEMVRVAQVHELLAAQAAIAAASPRMPVVYVGDYNSLAPSAAAYSLLVNSVGEDAWVEAGGTDLVGMSPEDTCCQAPNLRNPTSILDERIDLILMSDIVDVLAAEVIGEEAGDRITVGGTTLWPSDHAGVVATLLFPHPSQRARMR